MSQHHYDVIIIGAGTAGLSALSEVRKRTDNFLMVNRGPWGTTCARVGCMPSKLLIEAADAYHQRTTFETFGIRGGGGLSLDLPAVLRRVRALRDEFVQGTLKATDSLGDRALSGDARILAPDRIEVGGQQMTTRALIIATGSHPVVPDGWKQFGNKVLTTDDLFEQQHLAQRIGVVGLGPVGVEIAQALARLGITVSAYSKQELLAGLSDPDINATLREALERKMEVHTGNDATPEAVDGGIAITSGGRRTVVDQVLLAVGRKPNVKGLGLENLGVSLDARGMPDFHPGSTQVSDLRVFMAGDLDAHRPLLHEASDEGRIAGMNALADEVHCYQRRAPLAIVFTHPEVAVIGASHKSLEGQPYETGIVSFANQGRARAAQRNHGKIALYANPSDGKLLGAELCAPAGEHFAHLLALAIAQGLTVHQLLAMPIYHPTLEEGLRTALRDVAGKLKGATASDLAHCAALNIAALE